MCVQETYRISRSVCGRTGGCDHLPNLGRRLFTQRVEQQQPLTKPPPHTHTVHAQTQEEQQREREREQQREQNKTKQNRKHAKENEKSTACSPTCTARIRCASDAVDAPQPPPGIETRFFSCWNVWTSSADRVAPGRTKEAIESANFRSSTNEFCLSF